MRIAIIETDNGNERIKLVCEDCGTEATQDRQYQSEQS
jgi:hypothetical protein